MFPSSIVAWYVKLSELDFESLLLSALLSSIVEIKTLRLMQI